ncbi:tripartite tricarboxylate transporter TctB family protein, partial [Xenorhabdus bovienii]|uniref:tripartite tricarboxylate transporter TctB family protein n=2 Tax=Morganellaceae TaxID=1903414 RepID=UPI0023B28485
MAFCSFLLLFKKTDPVYWPTPQVLRRLVLLIASLVIYAWLFEWLGFPLATILLTISVALLFNATLLSAVISGIFLGISL